MYVGRQNAQNVQLWRQCLLFVPVYEEKRVVYYRGGWWMGRVVSTLLWTLLFEKSHMQTLWLWLCFVAAQRYPDAITLVPNQRWPEDQINKLLKEQQRLAANQSMIYWSISEIRKGQRRSLPSCVYMNIRAAFTPDAMTDEEFTDYDYSIYVPELAEAE